MESGEHLPLVLARIVALATVVYDRDAFTDQFAMNHNRQNANASSAVWRTSSGGRFLSGAWSSTLIRVLGV
jgi:hypothetical protein